MDGMILDGFDEWNFDECSYGFYDYMIIELVMCGGKHVFIDVVTPMLIN